MRKEKKAVQVGALAERLGRAKLALVSEYRGITANEATELRKRLRAVRGEIRVAKNTLIRRAAKGTPFAALEEKLGGPVGLILGFDDPIALAKSISGMRELGERLKVRAGVMEGRLLSAEEVTALATMPPREVLLSQLLGLIMAPATHMVRLLNEPGSSLARLADAIARRQAESAPPVEGQA